MLRLDLLAVSLCLLGMQASPTAAADPHEVDAAIVFAVDSSTSVDPKRADRQRIGHADALRSREVISAITGGQSGCIAISYFEWASVGSLRTSRATNTAVTTMDSRSETGTQTAIITRLEMPNTPAMGGSSRYSGMRKMICRVSSKMAALSG